jgi:hypothetical protein
MDGGDTDIQVDDIVTLPFQGWFGLLGNGWGLRSSQTHRVRVIEVVTLDASEHPFAKEEAIEAVRVLPLETSPAIPFWLPKSSVIPYK